MRTYLLTIAIVAFIIVSANGAMVKGGLGESRPADDEVIQLVARQKSAIIKTICDTLKENCPPTGAEIIVKNYKKQVVAGTNYFISATVGGQIHHIKIFSQSWTDTERVTSVQGPKQETDEITFF